MKKALSLLLSLVMLLSSTVFAAPVIDTVESSDEAAWVTEPAAENTEKEASAELLAAKGVKPGLNMLDQASEAAFSFEDVTLTDGVGEAPDLLVYSDKTASVIANPHTTGSVNVSDKALLVKAVGSTGNVYPNVQFVLPTALEVDRPIYTTFKYYKTFTAGATENTASEASHLWIMGNGTGGSNIIAQPGGFLTSNGDWKKYSALLDFSKVLSAPIKNISIRGQVNKNTVGTFNYHYDDIAFIPSYRINYMLNDGTDTIYWHEYFLFPSNKVTNTMYKAGSTYSPVPSALTTPTREGYTFVGWSKDPNATEGALSGIEFTLGNEDIALYAVWKKQADIKPGLNVWTGTEDALDFEKSDDVSLEEYFADFIYTENVSIGNFQRDDAETPETNKALMLTATNKWIAHRDFPHFDKDRPMDVTFRFVYTGQVRVMGNAFNTTLKDTNSFLIKYQGNSTIPKPLDWQTFTARAAKGSTVGNKSNPAGNVQDRWLAADDVDQLYFYTYAGITETNPLWLDDIKIVPYFKLSYDANGGEGTIDPVYFLADSYGELADGAALEKEGRIFAGWATTPDATEEDVITSVSTRDKDGNVIAQDITLYAVWAMPEEDVVIDSNITLTAPVGGKTPVITVKGTGYTGAVEWTPAVNGTFAYETEYTATITITPDEYYTTVGIPANGYTVTGAVSVTNEADSNVITATFAKTEDTPYTVRTFVGETELKSYTVKVGASVLVDATGVTVPEGHHFLGWASADGKLLAYGRFIPTADIDLYAKFRELPTTTKPGINLWGDGTFEKDGINFKASNGALTVVEEEGNTSNHIVKYVRNTTHASIQAYLTWEPGRTYKIGYKVKTEGFTNKANAYHNQYYNSNNHTSGNGKATNLTNWVEQSVVYTFPQNSDSYTYTYNSNDALSYYVNPNQNSVGGTVYYDDLVFIPYYKVTYDAAGGIGTLEEEQFLADSYTVSTVVPVKCGYSFAGWSLDGTNPAGATVATTPGEDLHFTALWEEAADQEVFKYEHTSTEPGIANGNIRVITTEEDAGYTTATMYLADENGILAEYTSFGDIALTNGIGAYTVSGRRAFPAEATEIHVVLSGEGLTDKTVYEYTIPEEHRLPAEEPLYTFWAISDIHLGGDVDKDYWNEMTVNRNNAIRDAFNSDADFMFINGDVINYGTETYRNTLESFLAQRLNNSDYNTKKMPVFLTNGNHEFTTNSSTENYDPDEITRIYNGQVDYLEATYPDIKITRDGDNLWYAADIKDTKFIFMSSPEMRGEIFDMSFTISAEQLKFVDDQLYDGEKSNKTTFLVTHVGMTGYIPKPGGGTETGIPNTEALEAILAKHPNTIVCSGHSHSDISTDKAHFTVVGDMTTQFTHMNDGCSVWLDAFDGVGDGITDPTAKAGKWLDFSTGQYVEVYADKIIMKGRKFDETCQYFGHAIYVIDVPGGEKTIPDVSIEGELVDGQTLTAVVDGDAAGYTYEWIIAGETVSTSKTYKFDYKSEYEGEYVHLRVTAADGAYASCNSDYMVTAQPETLQVASIKTATPQGIRYAGFVPAVLRSRELVSEYGFIVAGDTYFTDGDYSALKFNTAGEMSGKLDGTEIAYAAAAAYSSEADAKDYSELLTVDKAKETFPVSALADIKDEGYYFAVVLTNIPAERYSEKIVGKTYVKIGDTYYYGEPVVRSIYDMAVSLNAKYEAEDTAVPDYITAIITAVDGEQSSEEA